jgi:hypothetical protein
MTETGMLSSGIAAVKVTPQSEECPEHWQQNGLRMLASSETVPGDAQEQVTQGWN